MSLIQEALKRQREEQGDTAPEPVQGPPPVPAAAAARPPRQNTLQLAGAPTAAAPAAEEAEAQNNAEPAMEIEGRRSWRTLTGVLLLILLLAAGGVYMTIYAVQQLSASRTPAPAAARTEPEKPAAPPSSVKAPAASPPAAAPLAQPAATAAIPVPPAAPQPPPSVPPTVAKPEPAQAWPALTLTALVGKGARGSAVINGTIVSVGESIEGVEVVAIGAQSVELKYEGATTVLKVGGSTQ